MSTSTALEGSSPHRPFQMSCHVVVQTVIDSKCELTQVFLSLLLILKFLIQPYSQIN